jgi:hypothetical protein
MSCGIAQSESAQTDDDECQQPDESDSRAAAFENTTKA